MRVKLMSSNWPPWPSPQLSMRLRPTLQIRAALSFTWVVLVCHRGVAAFLPALLSVAVEAAVSEMMLGAATASGVWVTVGVVGASVVVAAAGVSLVTGAVDTSVATGVVASVGVG